MWGWSSRDLPEKTLGAQRRCYLRPQHLERDGPVMLQVVREIDRGHAAPTQLTLDAVATGQSGGETRTVITHEGTMAHPRNHR